MRAFYLVLCGIALAFACASPALADYAQSQAWFEKLDTNARFDLQTDLIFLGDYTGLIDGKFGNVTYAAVTKYQQSLNVEATGTLTAGDQDALHRKAKAIADGMGIKVVKEARSQLALAVPEKILTEETNTKRGMRFGSSDGGMVLETINKPLKAQSFHDLYLSLSTPSAGRKITYSMIDVARFIVSGTLNGRSFYTMFYAAPDDGEAAEAPPVSNNFGAFLTVDDVPQAIILNGQINPSTPLDFRRALKAHPDARILVLNSPGGDVDAALVIAHQVHDSGMSTFISKNMVCASACSYIYFAGPQREDDGKLGVHQISSDTADLVQAQTGLSDILDALKEFGVPQEVISVMLRTPPSDVHIFDAKEVADLGINQGAPLADPLAPPAPADTASNTSAASGNGLANRKVKTLRVNPDGSVGTPAGALPTFNPCR